MGDSLSLSMQKDVDAFAPVSNAVARFLEDHNASARVAYAVQLALEEMVTNLIRHTQGQGSTNRIEVSLDHDGRQFVLRLEDDSDAFDPRDVESPDLDQPLSQRPVGGLGIYLTRQMVDQFHYQRLDGLNRLEIHVTS